MNLMEVTKNILEEKEVQSFINKGEWTELFNFIDESNYDVIFKVSTRLIKSELFSVIYLSGVNILNQIDHIFPSMFWMSPLIKKIDIPGNIEVIQMTAFEGCDNLKEITFHKGLKDIRSGAFYHCRGLKKVILPEDLETMHQWCFWGCENLEYIYIPESIKFIEKECLKGCPKLIHIKYGQKDFLDVAEFMDYMYKQGKSW